MKKPLIACIIVLALVSAAMLLDSDPVLTLVTMTTYWIILDELEKEDEK